MSLFLLTFFLIYGGAHTYAFFKAKTALAFGWGPALIAIPLLTALACGPLISYFLGKHGMEETARAASWVAYLWMGLLFFFLWTNLALDAVNLLFRIGGYVSGRGAHPLVAYGRGPFLALVALCLVLGVYSMFEAAHIRTGHVRIVTAKLPRSVSRVRIAQISDVHLGHIVRQRKARAIADLIREANPDLLVATGDLVDGRLDHLDGLSEIFAQIRPPLGKFAITGNHEFYAGIGQGLDFIRRSGFTALRGEAVTVADTIRIAGVDDPAARALGENAALSDRDALGGKPSPFFTVLLKHRPELSPESLGLFDLQLSGHTHNGQIFPFRFLVRTRYPLLSGLYTREDGGRLYTSPGTGTWGPPMRFLSPPEVTIIDIETERAVTRTEGG